MIVDIRPVERQALARHTNDAGDNVSLSVHPAALLLGSLSILFVGDVVGAPGTAAVEERLPELRDELGATFCIVNGENAADGVGITPRLADAAPRRRRRRDHARQPHLAALRDRRLPARRPSG